MIKRISYNNSVNLYSMLKLIFSATILAFIISSQGCGLQRLETPDHSFVSSNTKALMVGRLEINAAGQIITPTGEGLLGAFKISLVEYKNDQDALDYKLIDIGSINVWVSRPDGFFAVSIPPGKYFVLSYIPPHRDKSPIPHLWPSFKWVMQQSRSHIRSNQVIVIDVRPGQANYVGDIKVNLGNSFLQYIPRQLAKDVSGPLTITKYEWISTSVWGIENTSIVNAKDNADQEFRKLFPKHTPLIENLATVNTYPLSQQEKEHLINDPNRGRS